MGLTHINFRFILRFGIYVIRLNNLSTDMECLCLLLHFRLEQALTHLASSLFGMAFGLTISW